MNAPLKFDPEVLAEAEGAGQALEAAKIYRVTSIIEYEAAGEELKQIKGRMKRLEDMRTKLIAPVLATQRAINEFFAGPKALLEQAEKAIKGALGVFDAAQRELREKAEREAAEAARKEQERLRMEAAKQEQAAREKREKEEAKARELEAQGKQAQADARREAAEAAEAARLQDAEAKRMAAEMMPTAPVVHMETPKVSGLSSRENWSALVTDKMALIKAVAAGEAPAELIDINTATLNRLAKALKNGLNYPGVKAVSDRSYASRSA
jgi:hypothetical protein